MTGLPNVTRIQSVSKNGISYVAVYFKDNMDVYRARQLVSERLVQAKESIPENIGSPEMGPISTGLGEIYQFKVAAKDKSPMELAWISHEGQGAQGSTLSERIWQNGRSTRT